MNNFKMSALINKLRNDHNYSIQKVADMMGVSKASVSKWENGNYIATEHLYDLSKLYNVSFSELQNGKLLNENNGDCWRRNYDLSKYKSCCETDEDYEEKMKEMFEHCNAIKSRFFEMIIPWSNDVLNNDEKDEFEYLKKYFKFDYNYACQKCEFEYNLNPSETIEKECINKISESIKGCDEKSFEWELTKLYDFKNYMRKNAIIQGDNQSVLEYLLSTFSQIEKDKLLYEKLNVPQKKKLLIPGLINEDCVTMPPKTINDVLRIPGIKTIINSGANCQFNYKPHGECWSDEMFNHVEGKVVEIDESICNKYYLHNLESQNKVPILEDWKQYSYKDYQELVDKDGTERLRDIVNLRDTDPLKYYERMVKRESISNPQNESTNQEDDAND